MENNRMTVTCGCGSGFAGLLTIAFTVLKLCGVTSWSWWWVISPIWISMGLTLGVFIITIIIYLITYTNILKKRKVGRK